MSKNKATKAEVQTTKLNRVVNTTENKFATEFGEELYGGQAREAFKQHQANKSENEQSSN
jgi:hypothetical protein